jgi:hypothetical protein
MFNKICSQLLFRRKFQEYKEGQKLDARHRLLVGIGDNVYSGHVPATKKDTEAPVATKKVDVIKISP